MSFLHNARTAGREIRTFSVKVIKIERIVEHVNNQEFLSLSQAIRFFCV